jgi:mRNA interferase RelE/StbE
MDQPAYKLLYKQSVEKDLRKIPKVIRTAIVRKIKTLATSPHPASSVKLQGSKDLYRMRHADYRIIYQIYNKTVTILIVKVGHRKEIYRDI